MPPQKLIWKEKMTLRSLQLVHKAINGDERAWDALVDEYGKVVFSLLRGLGVGNRDAEEITVAVFGEMFESLEQIAMKKEEPLLWLARKTNRAALDRVLSRRSFGGDSTKAEIYAAVERQWKFLEALRGIEPKCQEVLVLFLSGSLSPRDFSDRNKCLQEVLRTFKDHPEHGGEAVRVRFGSLV